MIFGHFRPFEKGQFVVKRKHEKSIYIVINMYWMKAQVAKLDAKGQADLTTLKAPYADLFRLANQHERLCGFRIDDLISHLGLKDARDILNGSKQSDVCREDLQNQWDQWHVEENAQTRLEESFNEH